jgi:predicted Zn-dependent protease
MQTRSVLVSLFASAILLGAAVAGAQSKDAAKPKDAAAAPSKGKDIRRDPEGKKGISPYMELIIKGDAAFVARDVAGATTTFQEAIKSEPDRMLGFYRLGEAEIEQGKLDDADKTFEAGLSKKGSDALKAKLLFSIADLRERQGKWQAAKDAWAAYAAFLQGNEKVKGYPATATERMKQADRRMKDEETYKPVRERIAKRLAEKEKEAAENAKKDKLNR